VLITDTLASYGAAKREVPPGGVRPDFNETLNTP
jgi:hypothetical protein